jgi:hypothetical protein
MLGGNKGHFGAVLLAGIRRMETDGEPREIVVFVEARGDPRADDLQERPGFVEYAEVDGEIVFVVADQTGERLGQRLDRRSRQPARGVFGEEGEWNHFCEQSASLSFAAIPRSAGEGDLGRRERPTQNLQRFGRENEIAAMIEFQDDNPMDLVKRIRSDDARRGSPVRTALEKPRRDSLVGGPVLDLVRGLAPRRRSNLLDREENVLAASGFGVDRRPIVETGVAVG